MTKRRPIYRTRAKVHAATGWVCATCYDRRPEIRWELRKKPVVFLDVPRDARCCSCGVRLIL